jgi:aminoglycoside phosphotransferase (APT) family kinase protein
MVEVPATTQDADAAFVTEALREGGLIGSSTRVAEVEHDSIGEGVGIVGQLARLQLRYHGSATAAPGTVILKIPSQYPENRAVGDHFRFYEREGHFYRQLADKVPVRTPRCYWNHMDVDGRSFGLLLEDLGDRTMISQVAGLSGARAASALRALAKVHGTWWGASGLDDLGWMPRIDDPVNLAAGQQYRDAWPLFVERIGDAVPAEALALGERVQHVFEDLLRTGMAEAPTTVCHGDFRGDNLMFDDRAHPAHPDDEVAVLDWQISYRGPAVTDVAYFLCQSLDVEERRAHERELVGTWHDELARVLLDTAGADLADYPFELAWDQYRRAALATTVYPVSGMGAMDPANERGRQLITAMAVRAFTASLDLDAAALLD